MCERTNNTVEGSSPPTHPPPKAVWKGINTIRLSKKDMIINEEIEDVKGW